MLEFVENLQDKGNVKVAADKQKQKSLPKSNSSDSGASTSDVSLSVFCGSSLTEAVKLLKSATEPLHQLIAEIDEELEKDSQLADSSRPQPKYDTLASKLKTQYTKSLDALVAVKQTKLQADVKNCIDDSSLPIISVERLDDSATEQTNMSETRQVTGDSAADIDSVESTKAEDVSSSRIANSMNNSSRASRADIEAQRDLHKQMLSSKDETSESGGGGSESSTSSSEDVEPSSTEDSDDDDDEYDPKKEIRQVKLERGHERRTTVKKQKMKAGN